VAQVVVVPGAAVRSYLRSAVDAVRARGLDVELLPAPGSPGVPADLARYGRWLGQRIARRGPVDVLVGLSVGAQAAAVAAAAVPAGLVRDLVLVSPTVDPRSRSLRRLLGRWLVEGRKERSPLLLEQAPDWWRAGAGRLYRLVRSAVDVEVERVLPGVEARTTVVHAEADGITSHGYAAALAADHGGRFVVVPGATHSWPYRDGERFADLIQDVSR
jgi:hypothetical protein